MKVMIVTDAWKPQVNGVVTTLGKIGEGLNRLGHEVRFVTPQLFKSIPCPTYPEIRLSLLPYAGVSREIEAFAPDALHIATEGPMRAQLERRYPHVHFAGIKTPAELARYYRAADVFVFPSLTDTFGLVMLEALACGTPVAAFPVLGPVDVIGESGAGILHENLAVACIQALDVPREKARHYAEQFSWGKSIDQFVRNLTPATAA